MSTQKRWCRKCDAQEGFELTECPIGGTTHEWGDTEPPPPIGDPLLEEAAESAYREAMARLRPRSAPPRTPQLRVRTLNLQAVLPFERESERTLIARPQRPFQTRGLMLWDVGTLQLEAVLTSTTLELVCAFGPVPARWFTVAESFEQLELAVRDGKEPPGWGTWSTAHPGQIIRLHFDGPCAAVQALMWGLTC